jgi:hypothetical protein
MAMKSDNWKAEAYLTEQHRMDISTPLLFPGVMILKTPMNGKTTMCEGKTLWKKWH